MISSHSIIHLILRIEAPIQPAPVILINQRPNINFLPPPPHPAPTACTINPPLHLPQLSLPLPNHLLPLPPHNRQNTLQTRPPSIQPPLHLRPLLLAKDPIRTPMNQESLIQLREFSLHESRAYGINDPNLRILGWDLESTGNMLIW